MFGPAIAVSEARLVTACFFAIRRMVAILMGIDVVYANGLLISAASSTQLKLRLSRASSNALHKASMSNLRSCVLPIRRVFYRGRSESYFTGTSTGAPLSLIKTTSNLAGLVLLAFRPTT